MSNKCLFTLMLWAAALAATGAVADANHTPPDPTAQSETEESTIRRVLEQFRTTQVSLSRAMNIAEQLHEGSRVADVSFEVSSPPVYRVRTVKNERVWENVIDANTGRVTDKEVTSSLKELDREDLSKIIALKWIKQELADAVRVAEKAADGNALAGGLMKQDGRLNFVIVVACGDHLKEVTLEPPKVGRQGSAHQ